MNGGEYEWRLGSYLQLFQYLKNDSTDWDQFSQHGTEGGVFCLACAEADHRDELGLPEQSESSKVDNVPHSGFD